MHNSRLVMFTLTLRAMYGHPKFHRSLESNDNMSVHLYYVNVWHIFLFILMLHED